MFPVLCRLSSSDKQSITAGLATCYDVNAALLSEFTGPPDALLLTARRHQCPRTTLHKCDGNTLVSGVRYVSVILEHQLNRGWIGDDVNIWWGHSLRDIMASVGEGAEYLVNSTVFTAFYTWRLQATTSTPETITSFLVGRKLSPARRPDLWRSSYDGITLS